MNDLPAISGTRPAGGSLANLSQLVEAIVASGLAEPRTRHIDSGHLPNRDAIIELVKKLREFIFPGYFGKQSLTSGTLPYCVGELAD